MDFSEFPKSNIYSKLEDPEEVQQLFLQGGSLAEAVYVCMYVYVPSAFWVFGCLVLCFLQTFTKSRSKQLTFLHVFTA